MTLGSRTSRQGRSVDLKKKLYCFIKFEILPCAIFVIETS